MSWTIISVAGSSVWISTSRLSASTRSSRVRTYSETSVFFAVASLSCASKAAEARTMRPSGTSSESIEVRDLSSASVAGGFGEAET